MVKLLLYSVGVLLSHPNFLDWKIFNCCLQVGGTVHRNFSGNRLHSEFYYSYILFWVIHTHFKQGLFFIYIYIYIYIYI